MERRQTLGLLLVLFGLGWLFLAVTGYPFEWRRFWPVLLILLGALGIWEDGWRAFRGGGGFLFLLGAFLLLFTTDLVPWSWQTVWPAGLILLGLFGLFAEESNPSLAVLLMGVGAFLLALTTGALPGGWRTFWPVLLILFGLVALVEDLRLRRPKPVPSPPPQEARGDGEREKRLAILARVRNGEISVEEGAALLEGLRHRRDDAGEGEG
ncbi:MAG: LiaI-LiaF-like domain-containing protein [Bacillota bacterium]